MGDYVSFNNHTKHLPPGHISDMALGSLPNVGPVLLVTLWDGIIMVYKRIFKPDGDQDIDMILSITDDTPLLSVCIIESKIYVGTVTGELLECDFENKCFASVVGLCRTIAAMGICKLFHHKQGQINYIICISWDGTINVVNVDLGVLELWMRATDGEKVITADCNSEQLIIATTGKKILRFDLPLVINSQSTHLSPALKYQIRDIKLLPTKDGYVISSIDGRVAVEYFNNPEKEFAFRCHRKDAKDMQLVYPVNCLAFVPGTLKLLTGGSDGCVSLWNLETKRKIKQYESFSSLSVVKMVTDGEQYFTGVSDDSYKTAPVGSEEVEMVLLDGHIVWNAI